MSTWLGKYIVETYHLTDRREDEAYTSWNETYSEYMDYKMQRIKNETGLDNYLMLMRDKNLSSIVYIAKDSTLLQDARLMNLVANLSQYEVPEKMAESMESGEAYFLLVDNEEKKIWECTGERELDLSDTVFGRLRYGVDADGELYLYIQGKKDPVGKMPKQRNMIFWL